VTTTYIISYRNIEIYLNYLKKELGNIFQGEYAVSEKYNKKNVEDVKGYHFYNITVVAREIGRLDNYKAIVDSPLSEIMKFKGITNIAFGADGTGLIILVYPLGFFEQDEYFQSLASINKYEL
jgi:hypothetical protein